MNNNNPNKLSNTFFNTKLFFQVFLQLKMVGIVSLVCTLVYTILSPVITFLDTDTSTDPFNTTLKLLDVASFFSPLLIVVYIITPLMCILIFGFLTSRTGSDFYHAAPVKRQCIFLSFIAAVLSWATIIVITFTVIFTIMISLFIPNTVLDMSTILTYNINVIISCLLVATVFGIGCSISGTIFTSITTSTIILVAPCFLITFFAGLIASINPFVAAGSLSVLTSDFCNMPAYILTYPVLEIADFYYKDTLPLMQFSFSTVYTLLLTVIYLTVGCIAFTKRPSESAQKAYTHKWSSLIFRTLIGYAISLIAVILVVKEGVYLSTTTIVIFAFALISMFIYEAITSRSLRKSIKSLIFSPIVVILDIISVIVLLTINESIKNDRFTPEDVEYIYISGLHKYLIDDNTYDKYFYGDDYIDDNNYEDLIESFYAPYSISISEKSDINYEYYGHETDCFKITDSEIIKMILEAYNNYCNDFADNIDDNRRKYEFEMTVDDGLSDTKRVLMLSSSECKKLIDMLINNEKIHTCFANTPNEVSNLVLNCYGITNEQTQNVYNALKTEIKNMEPSQWYEFIKRSTDIYDINYVNIITADMYNHGEIISLDLPITSITPKAYALYLKYYNENNKEKILDIVNGTMTSFEELNIKVFTNFCDISDNGIISSGDGAVYFFDYYQGKRYIEPEIISFINEAKYNDFSNYDSDKYILCYIDFSIYELTDIENSQSTLKDNLGYYILVDRNSSLTSNLSRIGSITSYNDRFLMIDVPTNISDLTIDCYGMTDEQAKEIYLSLIRELKVQTDTSNLHNIMIHNPNYKDTAFVKIISAETDIDGDYTVLDLPITSITPETYALYLKYYNENNKEKVLALLSKLNADSSEYQSVVTADFCDISKYDNGLSNDGLCYTFDYNDSISFLEDEIINFMDSTEYNDFSNYDKEKYYICHLNFSDETGCYILIDKNSSYIKDLEKTGTLTTKEHIHGVN